MTISFTNPGEIDMTSVEVMGLSAKECDSPIGRFGTGLKYAIAITLRLGGTICIWSGEKQYLFKTEKLTFRGKTVNRIVMIEDLAREQPLSFTTDYGLDWEAWQAMRELESNCRDEGGASRASRIEPKAGSTTIWVTCPEIEATYSNLSKYFITSKPFTSTDEADIHHWPQASGPSTRFYYRGVYVGDFDKPALYCYNFKSTLTLSEDRMIQSWVVGCLQRYITWSILQASSPEYIDKCLTLGMGYAEGNPDLPTPGGYNTNVFDDVVSSYITENRANLLNMKYLHWYYKATKKDDLLYEKYEPTAREAAMLKQVTTVLKPYFETMPELNFVTTLPNDVIGLVAGDRVYLAKKCFSMGEGTLLGTIYEELCHWKYKHVDESRTFQNHLVDMVANLMLELHFERESK